MNVLFISHDASPYGAPKSMINIIDGLQDEVNFIVLLPYSGGIDKELNNRRIKYFVSRYYWDVYNYSTVRNLLLLPIRLVRHYFTMYKTLQLVRGLHKVHKFDIVHTNSGVIRLGFYVAKFLNIPHVWHVREFQTKDYNLDILYGRKHFIKLLKKTTETISVSQSIKKYFDLNNGLVVYNGVIPEPISDIIAVKKDYFIFAASLIPKKGVYDVLSAFFTFATGNDSTELWICGTGTTENTKKIKILIENAGLQKRVKLLGYRSDVLELLKSAKACIVPSYHEAFGRITAEAMLMGCPVIGKASEGTLEIIKDQSYGWLYIDENELVNAMTFITEPANNEEVATKISKAKVRADALFTQVQLSKNIMNVYQNVLKKNNKI